MLEERDNIVLTFHPCDPNLLRTELGISDITAPELQGDNYFVIKMNVQTNKNNILQSILAKTENLQGVSKAERDMLDQSYVCVG